MTTTPVASVTTIADPAQAQAVLSEKFPGAISADTRQGYSGFVVNADRLVDVGYALRDELGYTYLSSVTGVDYIDDGFMEVVYHAYRIEGGPGVVFKARCPRENSVLPSLVRVWPGADFQEREAWDLYGIRFAGHPNLKRILLWEGFHGHPMRKDWKEAYYEQEGKPFDTRWPGGKVYRAEEKTLYGDNVNYPAGWTPPDDLGSLERVAASGGVYDAVLQAADEDSGGLKTDHIVVNLGPQHPSTHGVFRLVVTLSGETIVDLQPVMGYLHRNHEQIGERNTFIMNFPFTDRLDYISSMSNNLGYALAVEKLMGIKPPERAEYIRVLMVELTRIANHMWAIGFLLNDLGAFFTPALYAIEERELILDVFEATAGSRMMCNYMRFGGIARDLPEGIYERCRELAFERLPRAIDELDHYLTTNEIIISRCKGVGYLPPEMAIAYSTAGPVLRASGVPYDVRRAEPYSIYDRFDFNVAVRYNGDVYDRYLIRIDEMRESVRICQQALDQMPEGEIMTGKPQYQVRVPPGEAYGRVDNPKGELGFYVVSNGKPNPWRYHVRAPSFINLTPMGEMCKGHKVADVVVVLGSIDIVLGETDR
jgi:NADH-quinone oxidoreductase subunit D/NADH-quinone oxidoreductase subunit C/D